MKREFGMDLDPSGVDAISVLRMAMTLNVQKIVDRMLLPVAMVMVTKIIEQRIVLLRQAEGLPPLPSWV